MRALAAPRAVEMDRPSRGPGIKCRNIPTMDFRLSCHQSTALGLRQTDQRMGCDTEPHPENIETQHIRKKHNILGLEAHNVQIHQCHSTTSNVSATTHIRISCNPTQSAAFSIKCLRLVRTLLRWQMRRHAAVEGQRHARVRVRIAAIKALSSLRSLTPLELELILRKNPDELHKTHKIGNNEKLPQNARPAGHRKNRQTPAGQMPPHMRPASASHA